MESGVKNQRQGTATINSKKFGETDILLQWGNRKRLRCLKEDVSEKSNSVVRKKITSRMVRRLVRTEKEPSLQPNPHKRSSDNLKSQAASSPEKEERLYTTRGSIGVDENEKISMDLGVEEKGVVWPKLVLSLSSKEKEDDFMAMKGCKPPQRPKKRAKYIQKALLLVSPGAWLSDLCQERYEVREKKTSKKRPRGLKAMRSMESDTE